MLAFLALLLCRRGNSPFLKTFMTPQILRIFRWQMVRHALRHRTLAILNICSIALGVAVFLAIQIANRSANDSFAAGVDLVAGKAHLEARGNLPETVFPKLQHASGVLAATPLVEGLVTLPDFPGEYLHILGIDVFTNAPFRTFQLGEFRLEPWLAHPEGIAIPEACARRLGLQVGSKLRVLVDGRMQDLMVSFVLNPEGSATAASDRFAAMDIGWAQELFHSQGRLTGVEMLLDEPAKADAVAAGLRALVPPDASIEPPRQRSVQLEKMVAAFQLNLTALSMVSMLVGMFLIYNTILASVARSRHEIGVLRSLGTSRAEIRFLFLGEAALFGVVGIALGIAAGIALSGSLIGAVSKTISSLYVLTSIGHISLRPWQLAAATVLGMVAVLIAAWVPANHAAELDPIQALSNLSPVTEPAPPSVRWLVTGFGLLAIAVACSLAAFFFNIGWLGFAAAFFTVVGFACFAPAATVLAASLAGQARQWILLRLGAQGVLRAVHRNAVTVAALSAAIAMMVAVSVMIFSFRSSVNAWIDRGIVADLFIAPASNEIIGLSASMPPETLDFLRATPGVEAVDTFHEFPVRVAGRQAALAVVECCNRRKLQFQGGGHETEKIAALAAGKGVVVTESFSRKFNKHDGDELTISTPTGSQAFTVLGVYRDYTRDEGVIMIDRGLFLKNWDDRRINSLAVFLKPGTDGGEIATRFRQRFSKAGEYSIYPNAVLRNRIVAIFEQTFAVTSVLRAIAVVVAGLGIFLSVTTAVTERNREIGILRSMGASTQQVRRLFLAESGLIGVASCALGGICGCALAVILTSVVNRVYFGWTIDLLIPWSFLALTPVWIVPAALLAAWIPAWRAAKQPAAAAIRTE